MIVCIVQAFHILPDFLSIVVLSDAEKGVLSPHLYCGFVCFLSAQQALASCIEPLLSDECPFRVLMSFWWTDPFMTV